MVPVHSFTVMVTVLVLILIMSVGAAGGLSAAIQHAEGIDGFFSLEWVKRWNPDLQEPGIVFAHYKNYMDSLPE